MKNNKPVLIYLLIATAIMGSGCEAIGDIFKAGVWVGIIIVALVIGIIFWLINKAKK